MSRVGCHSLSARQNFPEPLKIEQVLSYEQAKACFTLYNVYNDGHCYQIPRQILFFILILLNTKIPLILHTKFQAVLPIHAIFNIDGHLRVSTSIMLHVKFEIHGCSGFREKAFKNGKTD